MRYLLFLILLSACAAAKEEVPRGKVTPQEKVAWRQESSLPKLLEEAKAAGRPVFVDFYADWCEPCKQMEREVYSRQDVAEAASTYLALKLDGERGEGLEAADKYQIRGFPTVLFFGPDGVERDRILGGVNAEDFLKALQRNRGPAPGKN